MQQETNNGNALSATSVFQSHVTPKMAKREPWVELDAGVQRDSSLPSERQNGPWRFK